MSFAVQEELEESKTPNVYDDYKFVTRKELGRCVLSDSARSALVASLTAHASRALCVPVMTAWA